MKQKYSDSFSVHTQSDVTLYSIYCAVSVHSVTCSSQFSPRHLLELEPPAQMSESVNVFMQDTVNRCHVSCHVAIP